METIHRYFLTRGEVIYAENDADAIQEAENICSDERRTLDNDATVICITRHDFAEVTEKVIYLKNQAKWIMKEKLKY